MALPHIPFPPALTQNIFHLGLVICPQILFCRWTHNALLPLLPLILEVLSFHPQNLLQYSHLWSLSYSIYGYHACFWTLAIPHALWRIFDMRHPYCIWRLSGQIYRLPSAIRTLSFISCRSNYYNLFCWRISFHSHNLPCGMPKPGYKWNGSGHMFLQSVFFALCLGISCIYMLLTFRAAAFLSLVFYVFSQHFFWNTPCCMQNIRLSKKCVPSKRFYGMAFINLYGTL